MAGPRASSKALPGQRCGIPPGPSRRPLGFVVPRDPEGKLVPRAYFSTNQAQCAAEIVEDAVSRWPIEVTYEESRAHLGVETQRQWSDLAIERSTPALFALFSLVTLWAADANIAGNLRPRSAAWYHKREPSFSDAMAALRRQIWHHQTSCM